MTLVRTLALCPIVALALSAGCSTKPAAEAAAPANAPTTATANAAPIASHGAEAAAGAETITGTVAETMDAASYTYVRVKTADRGEVWAAASKFPVAVGDRVSIAVEVPMQNFHSESLNRDFPVIYFASSVTTGDGAAAAQGLPQGHPPTGMPPGHPATGTTKAPVEAPAERIAPPAGGTAIADVWAKKDTLAGQSLVVRGKVMKFNGGIMGRNWIHLQDGSGSEKDGTHDLTVTTSAEVKPGDVVTVRGTLAVDKDFSAGYRYAVILEDAELVKP